MKTLNFKTLFAFLLSIGLMLSCSDDDVNDGLISPTRSLNDPGVSATKPITLNVSFALDEVSESLSCGEGAFLYGHSGEGSNETIGDYTMELQYCADPRSTGISEVEVTLEDSSENKIFLRQKLGTPFQDAPAGITSGEALGQNYPADDILNNDAESLDLYITGGTGIYSNISGELSSPIPSNFSPGGDAVTFTFSGFLSEE